MKLIFKSILYSCIISILSGCSVVSLTGENDIFGFGKNRDMMYSHGTKLTYTRNKNKAPEILKSTTDKVPSLQVFGDQIKEPSRYTFEIGQEMHTPDDISKFELQPDRNPFVGYLYTKVGKEEITDEYRKFAYMSLGTVGPNSFADKTQTWFHNLFGMAQPNGWRDNQIHNEVVFVHESGIDLRDIQVNYGNSKFEQTSGYNLKLGTWNTSLELNLTHRIGQNFDAFRASPNHDWSWQLYNKPFIDFVARDMTMDGNTFRDSHSVDKEPIVYGDECGVLLEFRGYALKLYVKTQTKQFSQQDKDFHSYGGFTVIKLFSPD